MDSKIEMMSQMVAGMLQNIVDEQVAKNATTNLDSVLEFIKNASAEDMETIFATIRDSEKGDELLHDFYQDKLDDDDSIINKNDLDVDTVDNCGLLEDCYNRYIDDACDLREIAKDIIDRI